MFNKMKYWFYPFGMASQIRLLFEIEHLHTKEIFDPYTLLFKMNILMLNDITCPIAGNITKY